MTLSFDKIPSEVEIALEPPKGPSVAEELDAAQRTLEQRTTKCKIIKPLYKAAKVPPRYLYKFFCVCPRYNPTYCCKHSGNVIIDRDVLTKEEHICYLATPKYNFGAHRSQPKFFHKRAIMPNCTSRIEALANPDPKRVKDNLENFKHILNDRHYASLTTYLAKKPEVACTSIETALNYIEEERRLKRVARVMEKRRCKKIRKSIQRKQRKQIRQIICVLFEEMKDFLLNDQFLVDERSTLCSVILEQIRSFTDQEFYTSSNLREYQKVLANNLTVWIHKFISNLNIHVAPPKHNVEPAATQPFLPVSDYISCSESDLFVEEECPPFSDMDNMEENLADYGIEPDAPTEETMKAATNP